MTTLENTVKSGIRKIERHVEKEVKDKNRKATTLEGEIIPRDPQEFYKDFGGLPHPSRKDENHKPVISLDLTPYQIECWDYKGNLLVVKGNKIGLTTSFSLEDFQSRLLPETAGYDCLLVAQDEVIAREHIRDLKNMIRGSAKYKKYLIERPDKNIMLEEKSKVSVAYIVNPYNPTRASRIIGIGSSINKAYSWKRINRIHMSDVALIVNADQKAFFGALYSRLANTNGVVKIESVPNGQIGEVWEIYSRSKLKTVRVRLEERNHGQEQKQSMFKVIEIPTSAAVPYGLVQQSYLDQQRQELGDLVYEQLYECKFVAPGNQWYKPEWFQTGDYIF